MFFQVQFYLLALVRSVYAMNCFRFGSQYSLFITTLYGYLHSHSKYLYQNNLLLSNPTRYIMCTHPISSGSGVLWLSSRFFSIYFIPSWRYADTMHNLHLCPLKAFLVVSVGKQDIIGEEGTNTDTNKWTKKSCQYMTSPFSWFTFIGHVCVTWYDPHSLNVSFFIHMNFSCRVARNFLTDEFHLFLFFKRNVL